MIAKLKYRFLVVLFIIPLLSAQEAQPDIYKFNPTVDNSFPYGFYVPRDMEDCYRELDHMLSPEYIDEFESKDLEQILADEHLRLGLWMRDNWGLHSGSRLRHYFNTIGIYHPDIISFAILEGYWNNRHNNFNDFDKWIIKDLEFRQIYEGRNKRNNVTIIDSDGALDSAAIKIDTTKTSTDSTAQLPDSLIQSREDSLLGNGQKMDSR